MLKSFQLTNQHGLILNGINYGASLTSLKIPCKEGYRDVLLGCPIEQYPQQQVWLGAVAGRFANRIANACLTHHDRQWILDANQPPHCLHGGSQGFHRQFWQISDQQHNAIELKLFSVDGQQGFPGNLNVQLQYKLENYDLVIEFHATTDQLTPVSLTSHGYFNLNPQPQGTILDHQIQINADYFLPVDQSGIPLQMTSVYDPFDLRNARTVGHNWLIDQQQKLTKGFDHAFIIKPDSQQWQACLTSGDQRLQMQMYTNQPSIQFYSGNWLAGTPDRHGGYYQDYAGLCLEAQQPPDSPNRPELGNPWLDVGQSYHHQTRYRFITL